MTSKGGVMPTYKLAKFEKQGRLYFIIPMQPTFNEKSIQEKQKVTVSLQECAVKNGFKGRVIPVWDAEDGSLNYFAPPYLQGFVSQLDLTLIKKHIKDTMTCDVEID